MARNHTPKHLTLRLAGLTTDAWEDFRYKYGLLLATMCVALVLWLGASMAGGLLPYLGEILVSMFLLVQISAGVAMVAIRVARREQASFEQMFDGFRFYVSLMLVGMIQGAIGVFIQLITAGVYWIARSGSGDWVAVALAIAAVLFGVVFGVFFSIRLGLAPLLVVDKRLPAMDAIKLSWAWSGPLFWPMLLLSLLMFLLAIGSALLLGVGLVLLGLPLINCMQAHMYHRIVSGIDPNVCARCGYDLRGITAMRCPECGTPRLPPPVEPITATI
ncbi:MAG: hypothetical protein K2W85_12360 [Phycisphaerales bacterium]|nr:hypothetical protein [Phycisphaerales bacterium]